ncbi:hypothetical protein LINGRAHAP2_LOCUS29112 [Linum grandiflorum]
MWPIVIQGTLLQHCERRMMSWRTRKKTRCAPQSFLLLRKRQVFDEYGGRPWSCMA